MLAATSAAAYELEIPLVRANEDEKRETAAGERNWLQLHRLR